MSTALVPVTPPVGAGTKPSAAADPNGNSLDTDLKPEPAVLATNTADAGRGPQDATDADYEIIEEGKGDKVDEAAVGIDGSGTDNATTGEQVELDYDDEVTRALRESRSAPVEVEDRVSRRAENLMRDDATISITVVDVQDKITEVSRHIGSERTNESMSQGNWLKRLWKQSIEPYLLARNQENSRTELQADLAAIRDTGAAGTPALSSDIKCILSRFQRGLTDDYNGEKLETQSSLEGSNLASELRQSLIDYANGDISRDELIKSKNALFGIRSRAFHDDILEAADALKAAHGQGKDISQIKLDLNLGVMKSAVTERYEPSDTDKVMNFLSKSRIFSFMATPLAAGVIASVGTWAISRGAWTTFQALGIGAVAGGLVAAWRRTKQVKTDTSHVRRAEAMGYEAGDDRSRDLRDRLGFDRRSAAELRAEMENKVADAKTDPSKLDEAVKAVAETKARLQLGAELKHNYVTYSGEGSRLLLLRDTMGYERQLREMHGDDALFKKLLDDECERKRKELADRTSVKDGDFRSNLRKEQVKAFAWGAIGGFVVGGIVSAAVNEAADLIRGSDLFSHAPQSLGAEQLGSNSTLTPQVTDTLSTTAMETSRSLSPTEMVQLHPDQFTEVARNMWLGNDTAVSDLNELKLHLVKLADGRFAFDVSHMSADGSFNKDFAPDVQQLLREGKLNMLLSMNSETASTPIPLEFDSSGRAIIEHGSLAEKLFSTSADGKPVYEGRFAEVAAKVSEEAGKTRYDIFSTCEGQGLDEVVIASSQPPAPTPPIDPTPAPTPAPVASQPAPDKDYWVALPFAPRNPLAPHQGRKEDEIITDPDIDPAPITPGQDEDQPPTTDPVGPTDPQPVGQDDGVIVDPVHPEVVPQSVKDAQQRLADGLVFPDLGHDEYEGMVPEIVGDIERARESGELDYAAIAQHARDLSDDEREKVLAAMLLAEWERLDTEKRIAAGEMSDGERIDYGYDDQQKRWALAHARYLLAQLPRLEEASEPTAPAAVDPLAELNAEAEAREEAAAQEAGVAAADAPADDVVMAVESAPAGRDPALEITGSAEDAVVDEAAETTTPPELNVVESIGSRTKPRGERWADIRVNVTPDELSRHQPQEGIVSELKGGRGRPTYALVAVTGADGVIGTMLCHQNDCVSFTDAAEGALTVTGRPLDGLNVGDKVIVFGSFHDTRSHGTSFPKDRKVPYMWGSAAEYSAIMTPTREQSPATELADGSQAVEDELAFRPDL